MARQPSGASSEGVVAIRHPRALDDLQQGWLGNAASKANAAFYPSSSQLLNSIRATDRLFSFNRRTSLTDFPQQGWLGKPNLTLYEAIGHIDWFQITQSFRRNETGNGRQNDKRTVYSWLDQPQQIWLSGQTSVGLDVPLFYTGVHGDHNQPKVPKVKYWTDNTPPDYGWIGKNSGLVYDPTEIGFLWLSDSYRMRKRNVDADKRYGLPFGRGASIPDPRNANAAHEQARQSFRMRDSFWNKYPNWRQTSPLTGYNIQPLPQAPFVKAQWPSIPIQADRARLRKQDVRITTLNDGYITANLVAPTFDAVWMVAIDQLVNSWRQQYVQQLTLSPGLGRNNVDGGALPVAAPFDVTTFPWAIHSQFLRKGFTWPKLTDQKTSFGIIDPAAIYDILAAQTASFLANRGKAFNDARWRQRHEWSDAAFESQLAVTTFDPIRMSSNFNLASEFMRKRKWFTSDPTELSWLIPPVLYDATFFNPIPAETGSFRMPWVNKDRRQQTYDPDEGWLFTGTPAFDPRNMAWMEWADRMLPRTFLRDLRQQTYSWDNAWNVFHPELIDWNFHTIQTGLRTNFPDRRQRAYDPDYGWNIYHPETINWHIPDERMAAIHAKIQTQQTLSEYELAWITANVPSVDPTTYIALLQLLGSFRAQGLIRDVRDLTEMVQISWLFRPLGLVDIPQVPPTPPTVDLDPHFTRPGTITPYWLVYPRRSRHRRHH